MKKDMSFADKVYVICKKVPKGKVTTYKAIADALGVKAYRAVGAVLHINPYAPIVPCHRVVMSDGHLGGFARGQKRKIELLKKEGIQIKEGKVQNFEKKVLKKII